MSFTGIQFLNGINEEVIPEIRLTKSKDGETGQAFFRFENPTALTSDKFKESQGMNLIDEEGQLETSDINIAVSRKNGKYTAIEAIYCWRTEGAFNRFMRFAKRYTNQYGLSYERKRNKKNQWTIDS